MRFQVPQFIDIEDRIGPLTVKQYIYTVGGAGMCYLAYTFLNFYVALLIIVPIAGLAAALAFLKINGKPFIVTLQAALLYVLGNRLYIWKRTPPSSMRIHSTPEKLGLTTPALTTSRLKDIRWALDIHQQVKK